MPRRVYTTPDLCDKVAKDLDLDVRRVQAVVNQVNRRIVAALVQGNEVQVAGLGKITPSPLFLRLDHRFTKQGR